MADLSEYGISSKEEALVLNVVSCERPMTALEIHSRIFGDQKNKLPKIIQVINDLSSRGTISSCQSGGFGSMTKDGKCQYLLKGLDAQRRAREYLKALKE